MKRIAVTALGLAAVLWAGLVAIQPEPQHTDRAGAHAPAPVLAALRPGPLAPEGEFAVSLWREGAWKHTATLGADKYNRTQLLVLRGLPETGTLRVRVEARGGGAAHLDALLLDGQPARAAAGAPLEKLAKADNDITNAHDGPIDLEFAPADGGRRSALLMLAGRIEPVDIPTEPFAYPTTNTFRPITATSEFYTYRWNSQRRGLTADGLLEPAFLGEPFFAERFPVASGHPQGTTYGWVANDDRHLYVALDFTPDNTMDGAKDYARVVVNTAQGVRTFTASLHERRWGKPGFESTSRAAYQHKVYEFAIPREDLGIDGPAQDRSIPIAFQAYGTATPGDQRPALAFDSVNNCFLQAHADQEDGTFELSWRSLLRNESGEAVGTEQTLTSTTVTTVARPAIAFDPTTEKSLAVWAEENEDDGYPVYARLLNADGTAAGDVFLIGSMNVSAGTWDVDVAGNETDGGFLVLWQQGAAPVTIRGRFVTADGETPDDEFAVETSATNMEGPRIAYDSVNSRFLAVYQSANGASLDTVVARTISATGSRGSMTTIATVTEDFALDNLDVAFDPGNEQFLVVWPELTLSEAPDMAKARLVDAEGQADGDILDLAEVDIDEHGVSVAFDPVSETYLAVWSVSGGEVQGRVINAAGTAQEGTETIATGESTNAPAVAANSINGGHLIVYSIDNDNVWSLHSAFVGSVAQAANRSLPPGAGYALLGLAALAALLWLGQQRLPRLRPAFATASLALALHAAVIVVIACSSSSGGGGGGGGGGGDDAPTTCQLE